MVETPLPGSPSRSVAARHPEPVQANFVLCDFVGASPKDDMASMEHPIFSLSTRPDRRVLSYAHGASFIEITPSVKGLATIHDKDILIYCVSQLIAALNAARPVSRRLELTAHDLLVACGRETSGDGYRRLRDAFERLSGTRITTSIPTGDITMMSGFGLIESWEIARRTRSGRMVSVSVTLSEWLYRAVLARSVLTLSRDYFTLRKPLERRLYEIARKHCGRQTRWQISMKLLCHKSGSSSPLRVFRKMVRDIAAADGLPEYTLEVTSDDLLVVRPREVVEVGEGPLLPPEALEEARVVAPGWDVHALEADWRRYWVQSGQPRLRSPRRAFVAYCAKRVQSGEA